MGTYEKLHNLATNINREGMGTNLALVQRAISHHLGDKVTVAETGPDWPQTKETKYFAQVNDSYAFGSTPMRAISNLLQKQ